MGPRLGRLRAFRHVAVAGGMTGAARALRLTQPAVSRAVQGLERDLDVALVERRGDGSVLTEEGRVLGRRVERLFAQLAAAVANATGRDPEADTVVRVVRALGDGHLRSLDAIWTAQTFRRAAAALDVAEPTLHRAARDLERLVAVSLYRRTRDGVGLSPAGTELARRFALAAAEIRAGLEELSLRRGSAAATITVGVLALAPTRMVALAAEAMLRRHPGARLTIREAAYAALADALRSGGLDLIFGALRAPPPFDDLREEGLFPDPYRIACRRDHPLAARRHLTPADLRGVDWVVPTRSLPRRAVTDRIMADWGLTQRVQIEADSLGATVSALAASDRISLLPHATVVADDRPDRLAVLDLAIPHPPRIVGLTTRADWLPTAVQADFVNRLREICGSGVGQA
ncbi:MAG: LysR family transcriptional regulator [Rhodoplanes sp.]|uniref:LysR family transcriptional regulator n=1 Tax=Rhodoplanes sp. TaxID=1968906 RepID=UPI00182478D0|nr:LysR family transcriptional regulator [Rhodoplanes sp.]NVO13542.1 LysR family transcriptional regulator [Rhodoplanes sp.]